MTKPAILLLALACGVLAAGPASARLHRHHRVHYGRRTDVPTFGNRRDLLETNRMGDRIISGRIGVHRDILSETMVPDSEGPGFIAIGRDSRSGVGGANGAPGLRF